MSYEIKIQGKTRRWMAEFWRIFKTSKTSNTGGQK